MKTAKDLGQARDENREDGAGGADMDALFAAGKMSLSKYISVKKNVVLSGSYKLDAPVIADGEEIVISGKGKPVLIEVPFNRAFCVNNKGRLSLDNVELRMPLPPVGNAVPLMIRLVNIAKMVPGLTGVDFSRKSRTELLSADNGSLLQFNNSIIEGATDCGIRVRDSEFRAENSEINHCRYIGIDLKNSSAGMKKLTIAENGIMGGGLPQVRLGKSTAALEKCTVRTSRDGDGIAVMDDSGAEISGTSIHGNSGNGVSIYGSSRADIHDCKFTENCVAESSIYAQIYLDKSSATIKNSSINNSRGGSGILANESGCTIESCSIRSNAERGVSIKNASRVEMRDCAVRENMAKSNVDAQISVETSTAIIEKCIIRDARGNGITLLKDSRAELFSTSIRGHAGNAISVYDRSGVKLSECRITGNSTEKKLYAQIYLENSTAEIDKSSVCDSEGGPGITLLKGAKIRISSSEISGNSDDGIIVHKGRLEMRDCRIVQNGHMGDCYSQVYIENAFAAIEDCNIRDGHWGYGVYIHGKKRMLRENRSSEVAMKNTRVEGNRLGLRVNELSSLSMSGCAVTGNREGDTLFDKGSNVTISDEDQKAAG
jgi:hypothetical protein